MRGVVFRTAVGGAALLLALSGNARAQDAAPAGDALGPALAAYSGIKARVDNKVARERLEAASAAGDPMATLWVARCLFRGRAGYVADPEKAKADAATVIAAVEAKANAGDPRAKFLIASAAEDGLAVAQDAGRATTLYRQACDAGEMMACTNLAYMTSEGIGTSADADAAAALYKKACDGGDPLACHGLAIVTTDGPQAASLNRRALMSGLMSAGRGVSMDYASSIEQYKSACSAGSAEGCRILADLTHWGRGTARNRSQALDLYKQACAGAAPLACDRAKAEEKCVAGSGPCSFLDYLLEH